MSNTTAVFYHKERDNFSKTVAPKIPTLFVRYTFCSLTIWREQIFQKFHQSTHRTQNLVLIRPGLICRKNKMQEFAFVCVCLAYLQRGGQQPCKQFDGGARGWEKEIQDDDILLLHSSPPHTHAAQQKQYTFCVLQKNIRKDVWFDWTTHFLRGCCTRM